MIIFIIIVNVLKVLVLFKKKIIFLYAENVYLMPFIQNSWKGVKNYI